MKKVLFICAMEKEGKQIANKLKMNEINNKLFENEDKSIRLLITGIGKQLTAINLTEYLSNNDKPELIINVGYAGSTDIQIGKWVNISKVYNYEWDIPGEEKFTMLAGGSQKLEIIENSNLENVECYSAESFVTQTDIKEHVAFDMELHSITLIGDLYDIPVLALKKISDNLSLDYYYNNLSQKEIFELTSCLDILEQNNII